MEHADVFESGAQWSQKEEKLFFPDKRILLAGGRGFFFSLCGLLLE
jgi:hypothetical protein